MPCAARIFIAASAAACLAGCVGTGCDPVAARRVLVEDGYTDIVLADSPDFASMLAGCEKHYALLTPFKAMMAGNPVEGVVCSGNSEGRGPQVRRYR